MGPSAVIFADPIESPFRLASFEEVAGLMRVHGEEYWNPPGLHALAQLTFCPAGSGAGLPQTEELVFTFRAGLGYHFLHRHYYRGCQSVSMFSCGSPEFAVTVYLFVGGGHELVFTNLFVGLEPAVDVVRRFFENGGRSDCIRWVASEDIPAAG
jgi:hypothetical protein